MIKLDPQIMETIKNLDALYAPGKYIDSTNTEKMLEFTRLAEAALGKCHAELASEFSQPWHSLRDSLKALATAPPIPESAKQIQSQLQFVRASGGKKPGVLITPLCKYEPTPAEMEGLHKIEVPRSGTLYLSKQSWGGDANQVRLDRPLSHSEMGYCIYGIEGLTIPMNPTRVVQIYHVNDLDSIACEVFTGNYTDYNKVRNHFHNLLCKAGLGGAYQMRIAQPETALSNRIDASGWTLAVYAEYLEKLFSCPSNYQTGLLKVIVICRSLS